VFLNDRGDQPVGVKFQLVVETHSQIISSQRREGQKLQIPDCNDKSTKTNIQAPENNQTSTFK
jgi:hypothetical protein